MPALSTGKSGVASKPLPAGKCGAQPQESQAMLGAATTCARFSLALQASMAESVRLARSEPRTLSIANARNNRSCTRDRDYSGGCTPRTSFRNRC